MKKLVLILGFWGLIGSAYGQQQRVEVKIKDAKDRTFGPVETSPEYPGGIEPYFRKNTRYPQEARQNGIKGRVLVNFLIDSLGSIPDSSVRVLRGIGYGCDEEAVRLVRNMARWKPGTVLGKPVSIKYNIPVLFPPKP
ncbi:energy transducer TonB [Larkinella sp. C7]|jgi:protein TonB|uniref:energy transducer TonB n=1 Tax=Larkinella sp. C7 TaxID=2576607 RepID=UPI0011113E68|nr:energy transducer TonB [Larkinella sp. C7]